MHLDAALSLVPKSKFYNPPFQFEGSFRVLVHPYLRVDHLVIPQYIVSLHCMLNHTYLFGLGW